MPYDPHRCRPRTPADVGAMSVRAGHILLGTYPHLRPCPITDPPWQWINKEWCETRCKNGKWQKKKPPVAAEGGKHNPMNEEVRNV